MKSPKKSIARERPTPEQKSANVAEKALKASTARTAKAAAATVKAAKKAAKATKTDKKEPSFTKPMNVDEQLGICKQLRLLKQAAKREMIAELSRYFK